MEFESTIKNIARVGTSLFFAANLVACRGNEIRPIPSPTSISREDQNASSFPDSVLDVYPQVSQYLVKNRGVINIGPSDLEWFNTSTADLDINSAERIYNYLSNLGGRGTTIKLDLMGTNDTLDLSVRLKQINSRFLLLVPQEAPNPSWVEPYSHSYPQGLINATTAEFEENNSDYSFTFIRIISSSVEQFAQSIFTTQELYANSAFNVEACHMWLDVIEKRSQLKPLAQELFCMSLGYAMTLRQAGYDYQSYRRRMEPVTLEYNRTPQPIIILPPAAYAEIPVTTFPLRGF